MSYLSFQYQAYQATPFELDKATAQVRKVAAKPIQMPITAPTEANPDESGLLPKPQLRKY